MPRPRQTPDERKRNKQLVGGYLPDSYAEAIRHAAEEQGHSVTDELIVLIATAYNLPLPDVSPRRGSATHCPYGHLRTGDDGYARPNSPKSPPYCRTCALAFAKTRRARRAQFAAIGDQRLKTAAPGPRRKSPSPSRETT